MGKRLPIVSFDIDGTVVKPEYNDAIWFKELPELYALKHGVGLKRARALVIVEYEKVGANDLRWYSLQHWLDHFGFEISEQAVLEKYAYLVEVYEEAVPVLDALSQTYTLVVATAMPHSFLNVKLARYGLSRYFHTRFSSVSDFSMLKKCPGFYRKLCEELGIDTTELVHVGDNYEADYVAACTAGVCTFFLDRSGECLPFDSKAIADLWQFVEKLRNL